MMKKFDPKPTCLLWDICELLPVCVAEKKKKKRRLHFAMCRVFLLIQDDFDLFNVIWS